MITVYSKPNCPHCVAAKAYLSSNLIPFTDVDVSQDANALAFIKEAGHKTVPQLYVGKTLLVEGGNAGLQKLTVDQINSRVSLILG